MQQSLFLVSYVHQSLLLGAALTDKCTLMFQETVIHGTNWFEFDFTEKLDMSLEDRRLRSTWSNSYVSQYYPSPRALGTGFTVVKYYMSYLSRALIFSEKKNFKHDAGAIIALVWLLKAPSTLPHTSCSKGIEN